MKLGFARLEPLLPELEPDYRRFHLEGDIHQVITGILLWILPYLSFALSDYFILETHTLFLSVLAIRMVYVFFCLLVVYLLKNHTNEAEIFDRLVLLWAGVSVLWNVLISLVHPGSYVAGVVISMVGVYSIYFFVPNPFLVRVLPPFIFSVYVVGCLLVFSPPGVIVTTQAMVVAFLITNVVGIVFSVRMQNERRQAFVSRIEEQAIRAELERLAATDPLTGVLNRRRLLELSSEAFYRFRRYHRPFSILVMDMDGFKRVNDTLGHQEGDSVLIRFAQAVHETKRESDALGRMGGDEFCLVLPETLPEAAAMLAERIITSTVDITATNGPQSVEVTVSIGISQVRADDATLDLVFARADAALYRAKHGGRNRWAVA